MIDELRRPRWPPFGNDDETARHTRHCYHLRTSKEICFSHYLYFRFYCHSYMDRWNRIRLPSGSTGLRVWNRITSKSNMSKCHDSPAKTCCLFHAEIGCTFDPKWDTICVLVWRTEDIVFQPFSCKQELEKSNIWVGVLYSGVPLGALANCYSSNPWAGARMYGSHYQKYYLS